MEKQGKVAIWVGNFDSEEKFMDLMRENYTEDGDLNSLFMEAFTIDYIDSQFQEILFIENNTDVLNLITPLSYAETFKTNLASSVLQGNSIVALFNFEYDKSVIETDALSFVGNYDYKD